MTQAIFINDNTLSPILKALGLIYLIFVFVAIPRAAYVARKNRKEGITAFYKEQKKLGGRPHPDYIRNYHRNDDEAYDAAVDCYNKTHGKENRGSLWMHMLLPAVLGALFGLILMIPSTFARWVNHKSSTMPAGFSDGLPDLILAVCVVLGVVLALFLPTELASKKKSNLFDYILAFGVGFSVAFAATMLGF